MRKFLLASVFAAILPAVAMAEPIIDETADPNAWVGPVGTTNAPSPDALGHPPESVLLPGTATSTSFTVGVQGSKDFQAETVILFAAPTNATISLSATACGGTCGPLAIGLYGATSSTGQLTVANGNNSVYDTVGLGKGGSETYTNYATYAPQQNPPLPIPANSGPYYVTAFEVPADLANTVTMTEFGAPGGTFVSVFSCETGSKSAKFAACDPAGDIASTPFTTAGLITGDAPPVPEPASIALLGVGLLGLGCVVRKSRA